MLVTDTAPWDRERESNAHLEDHNLASWPLDDRGHWVAARGVAPRSPAHEAGMFRLHHAAMEGLEKRGVRRPLGRVELPKARLLDACQTHSGVSGRLPQRRNVHRENPRRAPAAYIPLGHHARWCRSRRAVVGSVRLTGPSPEPRFSSMLRRHFSRRGRRRAELHRDLRFNRAGQGLSCYACDGPARSRTGIRATSLPRSPAELRVRGRGRIRTCDRLAPPR